MSEWLNDPDALLNTHTRLSAIANEIDDDANVPQRYMSTALGLLSDHDARSIREAASVMHRLGLWAKYPDVSDESYVGVAAPVTL